MSRHPRRRPFRNLLLLTAVAALSVLLAACGRASASSTSEPSYCAGRTPLSKPLSPSQWATCWKYGWDQPTTTAVVRVAHDFGHTALPVLIVVAIIALALRMLLSR
jgi:curli biogenesis system outer membrane secretion channel CsgG